MASYSLDQKSSQSNENEQSGRFQTANDNSGFHNSIVNYAAGGDLSATTTSTGGGIGQSMSDLPVWVWIAGGVALVVMFYIWRKKKK